MLEYLFQLLQTLANEPQRADRKNLEAQCRALCEELDFMYGMAYAEEAEPAEDLGQ